MLEHVCRVATPSMASPLCRGGGRTGATQQHHLNRSKCVCVHVVWGVVKALGVKRSLTQACEASPQRHANTQARTDIRGKTRSNTASQNDNSVCAAGRAWLQAAQTDGESCGKMEGAAKGQSSQRSDRVRRENKRRRERWGGVREKGVCMCVCVRVSVCVNHGQQATSRNQVLARSLTRPMVSDTYGLMSGSPTALMSVKRREAMALTARRAARRRRASLVCSAANSA